MGKLTGMVGELNQSPIRLADTARMMRDFIRSMDGASEYPVTRVKVQPGGALYFAIDNGSDDAPQLKEIEGVILDYRFVNAYWDKPMGAGGDGAPKCSSMDGVSGWDTDGMEHNCKNCPFNRMGSADGKRGKACKNMLRLIMMVEDEAMPVEVRVPTMSARNFQHYLGSLVPRGVSAHQVTTRLKLIKATNGGGIAYAQIMFTCTGKVDEAEIHALQDVIAPMLSGGDRAAIEGEVVAEVME